MARLSPITSKDQVPAKDHAIVDAITASRGALQGPFTMFLHSPEIAGRVAHLGAFVRFEGSLDMRVRVLAAMTVAREFEAVYVWGAQTAAPAGWACRSRPSPPSATAHPRHAARRRPDRQFTRQLLQKHRVDDTTFKAVRHASATTS
jgi:4-carboxymuconolactone decarboxylase